MHYTGVIIIIKTNRIYCGNAVWKSQVMYRKTIGRDDGQHFGKYFNI